MMGISWGGFNGLQLAALRPEGLKAVITLCSTVDRYADDIHHKGGAMLGENLGWAAQMLAYSSRPPDPKIVGEGWREMWLERLRSQPFLLNTWLGHQRRDAYWEHGSVCEDFSAIDIPVLAIGGWHDGYRNTPAALVRNLDGPAKAIVGPWIHKYPHYAGPEPRIGFLQEALRWWDRWLKGIETGVEDDPRERLWVMDPVPPARWVDERPGRWVGLDEDLEIATSYLSVHDGLADWEERYVRDIATPQTCGRAGGEYFPFAFGPELPGDQNEDDDASLCFEDLGATREAYDIIGAPRVTLKLTPKAAGGHVVVRLSAVAPDGAALWITHGVLNLSHRKSHAAPEPLTPGEDIEVEVTLDQCAFRMAKGHKLRVAVSTTYWPFLWPAPDAQGVTLHSGALHLPRRPATDAPGVRFPAPETAPPWQIERLRTASMTRRIEVAGDGTETTVIETDDGAVRDLAHGLETGAHCIERWSIHPDDPLSARCEIVWETTMARGDWHVRTRAEASLTADTATWFPRARLTAWEGAREIFDTRFAEDIPRDFM